MRKCKILYLCFFVCLVPFQSNSIELKNGNHLFDGVTNFHGRIISQPCNVTLESLNMLVDMDSIDVKTLYSNNHSEPVPFFIRLTGCKISIFKSVRTKFSGQKDLIIPGALAVSGDVRGIALQLLDKSYSPLKLDEFSSSTPLQEHDFILGFAVRADGYPDGIAKNSIVVGEFSAVTTFTLQYE